MQRHKIIARIVLLILSVINLALAAPVLVRGIRVDVVDVAKDVTTASRKYWNPSDMWWTNAPDRAKTPPSLGSSDSDNRLERKLRRRDPGSRMALNAFPLASLGSRDSESDSDPL